MSVVTVVLDRNRTDPQAVVKCRHYPIVGPSYVPNWTENRGSPPGVSVNVHVVRLLLDPNAGPLCACRYGCDRRLPG